MRIRFTGLSETIQHLEEYQKRIEDKQHTLLEKLAEIGIDTATVRFSQAQYDGVKDVDVPKDPEWVSDNTLQISAVGSTVSFIEFGTGVHYTESHPKAGEFGAIRGGYGHGLGKLDSWRYKGEPGTNGELITEGKHTGEILTHGNPPARAMYDAGKEMRAKIQEIAKEVYGHD